MLKIKILESADIFQCKKCGVFFMDIATVKAEATTRIGLPHKHS